MRSIGVVKLNGALEFYSAGASCSKLIWHAPPCGQGKIAACSKIFNYFWPADILCSPHSISVGVQN